MNPDVIVALIVALFFAIGVTVGIIAVIALAAVRRERQIAAGTLDELGNRNDPNILDEPDDDAGYHSGASGIPGHWDNVTSEDRPHWPGDTDNGYPGGKP
jgi:hypothetical protein